MICEECLFFLNPVTGTSYIGQGSTAYNFNMKQNACRYCFGTSKKDLIKACKCSGSIKYVHIKCLKEWVKSSRSYQCELCHERYTVKHNTYGMFRKVASFLFLNQINIGCIYLTPINFRAFYVKSAFFSCIGVREN